MKFSATLITIVACATLASSASSDFQQRVESLKATLNEKLSQASKDGNVGKLIENTLKLVNTAGFLGEDSKGAQDALKLTEKVMKQIESLIAGGPATRNNLISTLSGLVGSRSGLLGEALAKLAENMSESGNQPLAAIFKTAAQVFQSSFLKDENTRNMANKIADGIDMVEDVVNLLNNFSGGMIPQLNTIASAVNALDDASDTLLSREKDDESKNLVISKVLQTLYKMKNSDNQFAFEALDKVCTKMHAASN